MIIIQKEIPLDQLFPKSLPFMDESMLFYDIETTGFSPRNSKLYMIGCACIKNKYACITQFLASSSAQETELLVAFYNICKDYKTIVSFNGDGFDQSFLLEKSKEHHVNCPLRTMTSLDLYKRIKPYGHLFKLANLKQRTIEEFLHIHRKEDYSGKELISVYKKYEAAPTKELESLLLQHNYYDVCGLLDLMQILSYITCFEGNYAYKDAITTSMADYYGNEKEYLCMHATLSYAVPEPVSYERNQYYLKLEDTLLTVCSQIRNNQVCVPYLNYKDYYYLPEEDMAILKKLGKHIAKDQRKEATLDTCYGKYSLTPKTTSSPFILQPYLKNILSLLFIPRN